MPSPATLRKHRRKLCLHEWVTDAAGLVCRECGEYATGPLFRDSACDPPSPAEGMVWCDRCRLVHGLDPDLATHPSGSTVMIEGSRPPLVLLVCLDCLGPDDVVLYRGHPYKRKRGPKAKGAPARAAR